MDASTTTTTPSPILIPIIAEDNGEEGGGSSASGGSIPEWAMIEVNGELLLPKDLPTTPDVPQVGNQPGKENHSAAGESSSTSGFGDANDDGPASSVIPPDRIELGSLRFVDKARENRKPATLRPLSNTQERGEAFRLIHQSDTLSHSSFIFLRSEASNDPRIA
jgi:hypothetical protein